MQSYAHMEPTYEGIHRAARKRLAGEACARCGSTLRVQAALRSSTPPARLRLDTKRNCWYSIDPADYQALCRRHHFQQDYRLRTAPTRFRQRVARAPRCRECGQPMLCGQQGAHLSCALVAAV
jgi:hypothetical protein